MNTVRGIGGGLVPAPSSVPIEPAATHAGPPSGAGTQASLIPSDAADNGAVTQRLLTLGMSPPALAAGSSGSGLLGATDQTNEAISNQVAKPFDAAEVSTMFLEFMLAYRKAARLDKQSALEGQIKELFSAADKIRDAATSNFNSALAQGIASIVGGAVQGAVGGLQLKVMRGMKQNMAERTPSSEIDVAGGNHPASRRSASSEVEFEMIIEERSPDLGSSAKARASGLLEPETGNRVTTELTAPPPKTAAKTLSDAELKLLETKFQYLTSKSQLLHGGGQSFGGLFVDGPAKVYSAVQSKDASVAQAESQEREAQARKSEAAYTASSEEAQNAREAFNKVLDMVAEIERSRSETSKSIARI